MTTEEKSPLPHPFSLRCNERSGAGITGRITHRAAYLDINKPDDLRGARGGVESGSEEVVRLVGGGQDDRVRGRWRQVEVMGCMERIRVCLLRF